MNPAAGRLARESDTQRFWTVISGINGVDGELLRDLGFDFNTSFSQHGETVNRQRERSLCSFRPKWMRCYPSVPNYEEDQFSP